MPGQQDRSDFNQVVDANYQRIFRGALSVTGDRHLAEEIVQDTFVVACRKFGGFSGRSSAFTWLYGIMLNKYRDYCRKQKRLRRLGIVRTEDNPGETRKVEDENSSTTDTLLSRDEGGFVMEAVDGLPFKMRTVIAMHYFHDLTLNEIGEVLRCSPGTVKSRIFNARKRLYRVLRGKVKGDHENAMPRS